MLPSIGTYYQLSELLTTVMIVALYVSKSTVHVSPNYSWQLYIYYHYCYIDQCVYYGSGTKLLFSEYHASCLIERDTFLKMLVMFTSPLALRNSDIPSYPPHPHPHTHTIIRLQQYCNLNYSYHYWVAHPCVCLCVCVCNNGLWCVDVSFKLFTGCVCLKHS